MLALARDDREAAQAALDEALRTYAACVPAIVNAGNLLLEDGDVDGAIARFEAAIALDPDYPEAHHNLGVAYRRALFWLEPDAGKLACPVLRGECRCNPVLPPEATQFRITLFRRYQCHQPAQD